MNWNYSTGTHHPPDGESALHLRPNSFEEDWKSFQRTATPLHLTINLKQAQHSQPICKTYEPMSLLLMNLPEADLSPFRNLGAGSNKRATLLASSNQNLSCPPNPKELFISTSQKPCDKSDCSWSEMLDNLTTFRNSYLDQVGREEVIAQYKNVGRHWTRP